jgi:hypothetical protein
LGCLRLLRPPERELILVLLVLLNGREERLDLLKLGMAL